jgi:acetyltransferase-like isoleucine patch superfamily enzyme
MAVKSILRVLRDAWLDLRTLRWLVRLRWELRRNGGRLKVEGWRGVRMADRPRIRTAPLGEGVGVTTIRLSPDAMIGYGVILELYARGTNLLEVGREARIYDGAQLDIRNGTIKLAERCLIHGNAVLKSAGDLVLGERARVSYGACLHCTERIELGRSTGIGEYASVFDSDHTADGSDIPYNNRPLLTDPVVIEGNVLVGRGAVVLRGARIEKNSVVAANSVVMGGDYPPRSMLAGAPAKRVRELSPTT